ncbi:Piso0_001160 [Millerozyma farinosa CBS 7064]|uniref:Piso0_001160 protein n=1 Tax=Pichia sorbitophila (strain ATCC MYA-4447 / BCRC 22081 / CBS 7064 / NBRC 10061 / NRRL Y-12695) TaxID=559304 RepID=G8YSJ7_PICSO|nr:Piso0_001160 [Millerozyma farinosa CBS 7064]CCE79120.1 Piso0_001160 [Millerozyma farinosa CBS 7064]
MSHDTECSICLENTRADDLIGTIEGCLHFYHSDCIIQWSNQSNSCPTCRRKYYKVKVALLKRSDKVLKTINVQDKLPSNSAIDHIPAEFVIPASNNLNIIGNTSSYEEGNTDTNNSNNKVCTICSSSDYHASAAGKLINCDFCTSAFHHTCLGMYSLEDLEDITWCCPICDSTQELISSAPGFGRRLPRRFTTNRRRKNNHKVPLRNIIGALSNEVDDSDNEINVTPGGGSSSSRNKSKRNGLVIFNENGELDDEFLYQDNNADMFSPRANKERNFINGGMIMRKELREKERLTVEELESWNLYNKAKKDVMDSQTQGYDDEARIEKNISSSGNQGSRKKRKRQEIAPCPSSPRVGSSKSLEKDKKTYERRDGNGTTSRIAGLIKSLKSPNSLKTDDASPLVNNDEVNTETPPLVSLQQDNKKPEKKDKSTTKDIQLTFEQKTEIQKHIRTNLKPLYKPGKDNVSDRSCINSEDLYIKINKSVSKKLYGYIISIATTSDGEISNVTLSKWFESNQDHLKNIVQVFLKKELHEFL